MTTRKRRVAEPSYLHRKAPHSTGHLLQLIHDQKPLAPDGFNMVTPTNGVGARLSIFLKHKNRPASPSRRLDRTQPRPRQVLVGHVRLPRPGRQVRIVPMGNARSAALASAGEFLNGGRNDVACGGHGHGHIAVHHFDGILGVHALPLCLAHPVALGKQRLRTEEGIPGLHPLQLLRWLELALRPLPRTKTLTLRRSGREIP